VDERDPREWATEAEADAEADRLNMPEPAKRVLDRRGQRFWLAVQSEPGTWHVEARRTNGSWRSAIADTFVDFLLSGALG